MNGAHSMFEQILYDVATSRLSLLFDALDIDNSGALAKPELVSFARSIAPAELERWGEFWKVVSAEADADRDGRIDRDEWMNFWSRQWFKCGRTDYPQFDATIAFFESIAVHAQNRRVEELFVYLDADGSGEITKKELIQWIMVLPPKYRASRSEFYVPRSTFTHLPSPAPPRALNVRVPPQALSASNSGKGWIRMATARSRSLSGVRIGKTSGRQATSKRTSCGSRLLHYAPSKGAVETSRTSFRSATQSGHCQVNRWGGRMGRLDPLGCRL
jgi:Ca2+-binding EF-hand superfamily protein